MSPGQAISTGDDAPRPDGAGAPEAEFDEEALAELNEDLGADTFARLLGKCAEDAEYQLRKLETAIAEQDLAATRAIAHQLKGLFAQFGALDAARAAFAVERDDGATLAAGLGSVQSAAARALARFAALRAAL